MSMPLDVDSSAAALSLRRVPLTMYVCVCANGWVRLHASECGCSCAAPGCHIAKLNFSVHSTFVTPAVCLVITAMILNC